MGHTPDLLLIRDPHDPLASGQTGDWAAGHLLSVLRDRGVGAVEA